MLSALELESSTELEVQSPQMPAPRSEARSPKQLRSDAQEDAAEISRPGQESKQSGTWMGFRKDPAGVYTVSCISLRMETEGKAELWGRQEQGKGQNAQVILCGQK